MLVMIRASVITLAIFGWLVACVFAAMFFLVTEKVTATQEQNALLREHQATCTRALERADAKLEMVEGLLGLVKERPKGVGGQ